MSDEELIAAAREYAKDFFKAGEQALPLETLPLTRVIDAAVVYFESPDHDGRIEVFLDRKSGECISAIMSPRKAPSKL
jgi:hypothetical protein